MLRPTLFSSILLTTVFATGTISAAEETDTLTLNDTFTGVATFFDSLGTPYGGCGLPQWVLETPNFLALNVQSTPGDYQTYLRRPIDDWNKAGAWANGLNCGRWVRVTIREYCSGGLTSGAPGTSLCQGGNWMQDEYSGTTQDFIVADSCQDGNVFCRDSWAHVDLATSSLERFRPGLSSKWGNRQVSWQFIDAPNYQGDIQIGFRQNAMTYWAAIVINHLPRGIHRLEQLVNGSWQSQRMDSDMGQSFVLTNPPDQIFRIRIYDASDNLLNGGRVYEFTLPPQCANGCKADYTRVDYRTF